MLLGKSCVLVLGILFGFWSHFLFYFAIFFRWRNINLAVGFADRFLVLVLLDGLV